ncbi:hypothetical protein OIU79_022146, partial [Salix purpurea]
MNWFCQGLLAVVRTFLREVWELLIFLLSLGWLMKEQCGSLIFLHGFPLFI